MVLLSIEADEKCGKTTMALTAPLPIVCFSFDLGTDRAINGTKYDEWFKGLKIEHVPYGAGTSWSGNDITIYDLPWPLQLNQDLLSGFTDLWSYFMQLFVRAAMDQTISTIVVDTMTLCRRVRAEAHLQTLQEDSIAEKKRPRKQLLQIEYGPVNNSIRSLYDAAKTMDKNLIAVHHLTDEYKPQLKSDGTVESMATGARILEGLTGTYRAIGTAVRSEKVGTKFFSKIVVCGDNPVLEGMSIVDCSWDTLVGMISSSLGGRIQIQRRGQEVAAK